MMKKYSLPRLVIVCIGRISQSPRLCKKVMIVISIGQMYSMHPPSVQLTVLRYPLYTQTMIIEKSPGDRARWFDPSTLLIQLGLITTLAIRLTTTGWAEGLARLINLVLYAFILGVWLGQSTFRRWISIVTGLLYGLVALFWTLAQIQPLTLPWLERTAVLVIRIRQAGAQFLAGTVVEDPLLFLAAAGLTLWIVTAWSAFTLVRDGSPWFSIVSVSILLLIVDRYNLMAEHRVVYFISWMFFCLLLATRCHLLHERRRWQANHSLRDSEAAADINRVAWGVILALLLVVWIIPAMAAPNGPMVRIWRDLTRPLDPFHERAANAFAPLQGDPQPHMLFSSNYLSLGTEISQENLPVMQITTDALPLQDDRFFWRARNYDTYHAGVWTNSTESTFPITRDWQGSASTDGSRQTYHISVEVLTDHLSTLYTEQQPSEFSVDARGFGYPLPDGTIDLHRVEPETELIQGGTYSFRSEKVIAGVADLINSDSSYPGWVTANYLSVPSSVAAPIRKLAAEITVDAATPYEKAVAITRYLRGNYSYNTKASPPPEGTDPILYFLFQTRQGYCTYYATAEVLLLRAAGIPARMVVGFSEGELLEGTHTYLIQMKNLHAWPEVYFHGYGWVPFEPTVLYEAIRLPPVVDQAALEREQEERDRRQREQATAQTTPLAAIATATDGTAGASREVNLWPVISLALILAVLTAVVQLLRKTESKRPTTLSGWVTAAVRGSGLPEPGWLTRWHRDSTAPIHEQQYNQIARAMAWLGDQPQPGDTPAETGRRWAALLPEQKQLIEQFMAAYQQARFSPHPPAGFNPLTARQVMQSARRKAIRRTIFRKD